jgi:hypothetical protein
MRIKVASSLIIGGSAAVGFAWYSLARIAEITPIIVGSSSKFFPLWIPIVAPVVLFAALWRKTQARWVWGLLLVPGAVAASIGGVVVGLISLCTFNVACM